MGRPRKPLQAHRLAGTFRPSIHGTRCDIEAAGTLAAMPPPTHLNEAEALIWHATLAVAPAGLLKAADGELLATYCSAVARHHRAKAEYWAAPLLAMSTLALARELTRLALLIRQLANELGLSPIARTRANVPPAPAGSLADIETPEFVQRFGRLRLYSGGRPA